jgi:hypothetical protein
MHAPAPDALGIPGRQAGGAETQPGKRAKKTPACAGVDFLLLMSVAIRRSLFRLRVLCGAER